MEPVLSIVAALDDRPASRESVVQAGLPTPKPALDTEIKSRANGIRDGRDFLDFLGRFARVYPVVQFGFGPLMAVASN